MAFPKPPSCKFLSARSSEKDSTSHHGHTVPGSWCGDLFSFRFLLTLVGNQPSLLHPGNGLGLFVLAVGRLVANVQFYSHIFTCILGNTSHILDSAVLSVNGSLELLWQPKKAILCLISGTATHWIANTAVADLQVWIYLAKAEDPCISSLDSM